jgi:hypothetical protein
MSSFIHVPKNDEISEKTTGLFKNILLWLINPTGFMNKKRKDKIFPNKIMLQSYNLWVSCPFYTFNLGLLIPE